MVRASIAFGFLSIEINVMSISMTASKLRSESIKSAIRSFGLYAVPIVEFAAIAFGRDLAVVSRRFGYYRVLLAGSRHLFILPSAVLIVSLLAQKRRAFAHREASFAAAIPGRFLLAAHLLAFAAFWILTIVLFGSSRARLQSPGMWLLSWGVCGGAMIATWALRAFPSVWRSPAVRGILESIAIGSP